MSTADIPGKEIAEANLLAPAALRDHVETLLAGRVQSVQMFRGEVTVRVAVEDVPAIVTMLKDEASGGFRQLSDMTAIDHPARQPRFDLVYQLLSVQMNRRLRLIAGVEDGAVVPSLTAAFSSASWAEREIWDMFGIFFAGHGDLRRLLTDYGFEGHPLRKDFPLTGHVEVRYDDQQKRVVYEAVELTQEYRDFDFTSPWEGIQTTMRQDDPASQQHAESEQAEIADKKGGADG